MSNSLKPERERSSSENFGITITSNGPYSVAGSIPLDEKLIVPLAKHREYRDGRVFPLQAHYMLCRCGNSSKMPFCSGAHRKAVFNKEEVASRAPYDERAGVFEGPRIILQDDERCAYARFCHREHGEVWTLTEMADDEELKQEAIKAAQDCPTGRLTPTDRADGSVLEPVLPRSISVLQDTEFRVSGPLYVKGRIPVRSSDGSGYEIRNRVALCRCGQSQNMPFCDAQHIRLGFRNGYPDWE